MLKRRGGRDSQTQEINMLSASCCCTQVTHHYSFALKHCYTVFKGHVMCCVCLTCMQDRILSLRPLVCLQKSFNCKIIDKGVKYNPSLPREVVELQIFLMISVMKGLRKIQRHEIQERK